MIELENVAKTFSTPDGDLRAVDNVSLVVEAGETVCLIGKSGCGKTTTMKLMNRLVLPTTGRIKIDGGDIAEQNPVTLRRRIGYVIQTGGLFPHMTVADNIGLLCQLEAWPEEKRQARIDELLTLVNLAPDDFRRRYPRDLSGGERQRVGVARALALDPDYVLMDEPFGALDPITRHQVTTEFVALKKAVAKTIVLVTHDLDEAFRLSDRIALMDQGKIVQFGTGDELLSKPASPFVEKFLAQHLSRGTARA